mmetsp:Transcript_25286/g.39670  ORF Transcript_25286/g.39670 Transcript_25286/m.39670 type:complete len:264 (+) Transcript_25286:398-1189(+)
MLDTRLILSSSSPDFLASFLNLAVWSTGVSWQKTSMNWSLTLEKNFLWSLRASESSFCLLFNRRSFLFSLICQAVTCWRSSSSIGWLSDLLPTPKNSPIFIIQRWGMTRNTKVPTKDLYRCDFSALYDFLILNPPRLLSILEAFATRSCCPAIMGCTMALVQAILIWVACKASHSAMSCCNSFCTSLSSILGRSLIWYFLNLKRVSVTHLQEPEPDLPTSVFIRASTSSFVQVNINKSYTRRMALILDGDLFSFAMWNISTIH